MIMDAIIGYHAAGNDEETGDPMLKPGHIRYTRSSKSAPQREPNSDEEEKCKREGVRGSLIHGLQSWHY